MLQNGEIAESGSYKDLQVMGSKFSALTGAHARSLDALGIADVFEDSLENIDKCSCTRKNAVKKLDNILKENPLDEGDAVDVMDVKESEMAQLVEDEKTEIGKVNILVYWDLMRAAYGGALIPIILIAQTMFQCLQIASNYWIAWATPETVTEEPAISVQHMLFVYMVLSFGSAACVIVRTFSMAAVTLKTGQNFFTRMLHSIFHASMAFLDSTPIGRILNRVRICALFLTIVLRSY